MHLHQNFFRFDHFHFEHVLTIWHYRLLSRLKFGMGQE